jgi:DNA-binding NtrC family response regulator
MRMTILIIDDEKTIRWSLGEGLRSHGFEILEAASGEEGLQLFADKSPDCVLLDMRLPGIDGLEVLRRMRKENSEVPVIVMTAYGEVDKAVEAMKLGSYDFVTKPFMIEKMKVTIEHALTTARLRSQLRSLDRHNGDGESGFIGKSTAMQDVFRVVRKIGQSKATTVLITGESGTGKELVSRAIHEASHCDGPFVEINCGALPEPLLESELFGHEKGAFTDAKTRKRGLVEVAEGGTLFLDEIGDMDLAAQAKVLRALQNGEIVRVGSEQVVNVDVRVLAATNKDIPKEVAGGRFREDLFFRLAVFPIRSPALRERMEDIHALSDAFIAAFCKENGLKAKKLDAAVYGALERRSFPGNVRELKNVIERAVVLADGPDVTPQDLPAEIREAGLTAGMTREAVRTYHAAVEEFKRGLIASTLRRTSGNRTRAARLLGLQRTYLARLIRDLGLAAPVVVPAVAAGAGVPPIPAHAAAE